MVRKVNKFKRTVTLTQVQIETVEELLNEEPGLTYFSDGVGYAILSLLDKKENDKKTIELEKELKRMTKELSVLTELIAGGFDTLGVKVLPNKEDTYVYPDAIKHVENNIRKSVTKKSNKNETNLNNTQLFN